MNVEFTSFRFTLEEQDLSATSTPPEDLRKYLNESGIPFRVEEAKLTAEQAKDHPDTRDMFEKDKPYKPKEVFVYKFFTYSKYKQQAGDVLEKLMKKYEKEAK